MAKKSLDHARRLAALESALASLGRDRRRFAKTGAEVEERRASKHAEPRGSVLDEVRRVPEDDVAGLTRLVDLAP